MAPVIVTGAGFIRREPVTVTVRGAWVKRVRTDARGNFVARYPDVEISRCDGYVVTAVGSRGSRASLRARAFMCASTNPG